MGKAMEHRGGARKGAGRKKLGKATLYAAIPHDALNELKKRAKSENMLVGDWLVKHLGL